MTTQTTGMAYAIGSEIIQRLNLLASDNQSSVIDLRSLPMTQADRDQLEALLGHGEVSAQLDIAGPSEVWETAFSGVWWIRHMGADRRIACEEIAITRIPEILQSQPEDVADAAGRLSKELGSVKDRQPEVENPHV